MVGCLVDICMLSYTDQTRIVNFFETRSILAPGLVGSVSSGHLRPVPLYRAGLSWSAPNCTALVFVVRVQFRSRSCRAPCFETEMPIMSILDLPDQKVTLLVWTQYCAIRR